MSGSGVVTIYPPRRICCVSAGFCGWADQRDEKGDDRREGGETKKRTNETSFPWVYPGKRPVSKDNSLCSAMYWWWTIWRWPMGLNVTGSVPSPM